MHVFVILLYRRLLQYKFDQVLHEEWAMLQALDLEWEDDVINPRALSVLFPYPLFLFVQ